MINLQRAREQASNPELGANPDVIARGPAAPSGLWKIVLGGTADAGDFYQAWLALQCGMVGGVTAGLLLLRSASKPDVPPYVPAAAWPDAQHDLNKLAQVAQQAATERRSVVARSGPGASTPGQSNCILVAQPIGSGTELPIAIVVVAVDSRPDLNAQTVAQQLAWGAGWLETLLTRQSAEEGARRVKQAAAGLDLLAVAGEHRQLRASAMALANELAGRLQCDRVSIGVVNRRRNGVRLKAMSHTALFRRESQAADVVENAMEEALDQSASVSFPPSASTQKRIAIAHRALANWSGGRAAVASVMLSSRGRSVGVVTLERHRDEPFDEDSISLCEMVAGLVGPMIDLQHDSDRIVSGRVVASIAEGTRALVGPRRPALKLAAIAAVLFVAFLALATGEHRVSAKSVTEGLVQRAAVAPFDGFIQSAPMRAGDQVREGEVLASLNDRDLVLDRLKSLSERDKLVQKHRDALAKHDRAETAALSAEIKQAEAQLALAEDKLARTRIVAPFDGTVVSGDLSQMLGTPVERGKVLFEIAPLDGYRVILQVDERDIGYIGIGQRGRLALAGLPAHLVGFIVTKVTPIATAEEGQNFFRIEAHLDDGSIQLRPGMEGVGKIETGRASLFWIWTHPLVEWVRLSAWKWLP
jgi:multidrug resistance efflux pump